MKIGVLSDTHLRDRVKAQMLARQLLAGPFADVEAVLHAGDMVLHGLADFFAPLPWYAVRGNMDHDLYDVPVSRVVTFAGRRIGMIHGWGSASDIEERVMAHFAEEPVDAIVFGHSHQPLCYKHGSVLLFNPGSATDRRNAERHTVGILTIDDEIFGEIIPID